MTTKSSISVRDLTLNFGAVSVLKNLNLEVAEGEFIVLLGPSGCGKSTLLNCLAGLLDLSDGQIWIKGQNVTWAEPNERGIGMVFQSYALYPQMTVRGNLSFGLKNARMPQAEIDKRVARAAEILQIGPLLDRKPGALSGGQRQRVAIGRALVRDVDVFLFDEPLSNLDAKLRVQMRTEIRELHQRLKRFNIITRKYFYPLCSDYDCYRHLPSADPRRLPNAHRVASEVLSLPLHGGLSADDVHRICDAIVYSLQHP